MYVKLLSISASPGEGVAIPANPEPDVAESQPAMGTVFEILIYGPDKRNLSAAARQALGEIVGLDEQLSRWKTGSQISWINSHAGKEPVRVEPELFGLLVRSREIWRETGGAFDITVAALVKRWGFYDRNPRLPTPQEIESALEAMGMQYLRLDEADRTISFERAGMEIDLGGIGKGYAVDRAADFLKMCGLRAVLVNSGTSTIYAVGSPPGQEAWNIGIRDPRDESRAIAALALREAAVSTSGGPEKVFEIAEKSYSHILDPRTGYPAEGMVSATAIAPCATDSDALATSFYVLGETGTRSYCDAHKDVKALLIRQPKPGEELRILPINFDRK